jgi:hypothetical protein
MQTVARGPSSSPASSASRASTCVLCGDLSAPLSFQGPPAPPPLFRLLCAPATHRTLSLAPPVLQHELAEIHVRDLAHSEREDDAIQQRHGGRRSRRTKR